MKHTVKNFSTVVIAFSLLWVSWTFSNGTKPQLCSICSVNLGDTRDKVEGMGWKPASLTPRDSHFVAYYDQEKEPERDKDFLFVNYKEDKAYNIEGRQLEIADKIIGSGIDLRAAEELIDRLSSGFAVKDRDTSPDKLCYRIGDSVSIVVHGKDGKAYRFHLNRLKR